MCSAQPCTIFAFAHRADVSRDAGGQMLDPDEQCHNVRKAVDSQFDDSTIRLYHDPLVPREGASHLSSNFRLAKPSSIKEQPDG